MNQPPTDGIRVPATTLCDFVTDIFRNVSLPEDHASLVAECLVDTDLRGVVSHGVTQVERYVRGFQANKINPQPEICVLREGPVTAALSGGGGLGFIASARAMAMAIIKAKDLGIGTVTTTNHDHMGSCGVYVRMALREQFIGVCCAGRSAALSYDYRQTIAGSIQGSPPMALGIPSGPQEPPILLDFGTKLNWDEDCFRKIPEAYLRMIGLSHIANILGGTLGGMMLPEFNGDDTEYNARVGEGSICLAIDIERFTSLQAFQDDMDHLMQAIRQMNPLPGYDASHLPGSREWRWEKDHLQNGVPISAEAKSSLERLGKELACDVPW